MDGIERQFKPRPDLWWFTHRRSLCLMDPVLRTALDWFVEETHASPTLAEVSGRLRELRAHIDKLPSRVFYLESPDEPYALVEILMAMGKRAIAWQTETETEVERKLLRPQVEEILEKAVDVRGLLEAVFEGAQGEELLRLPQGEIRRSMESRGEPLPDRLL